MACLSFGEVDRFGNVNVARFGGMMPGSGGFINIVHAARKLVFCGTLTAKGLRTSVSPAGLRIEREGQLRRFVQDVELITFNGEAAVKKGQEVVYVTERAVFRRERDGTGARRGGARCRRPAGRAGPRRVPGAGEPGPPADAGRSVRRRMTASSRADGSSFEPRGRKHEASRSVVMERDVQGVARADVAVELAARRGSRRRRVFFPLLLARIAEFQALDTRLLYLTRSMGASAWQTFWYVRFPSALHVIFAGGEVGVRVTA